MQNFIATNELIVHGEKEREVCPSKGLANDMLWHEGLMV